MSLLKASGVNPYVNHKRRISRNAVESHFVQEGVDPSSPSSNFVILDLMMIAAS